MTGGDWSDGDPSAGDPHPAIKHFAQRLNELTAQWRVHRTSRRGKPMKLTPRAVCKLLREQAPHLAPSQSQVYRYYKGEAGPSILLIYEFALLFNVSPQTFLPENAPASTQHHRLVRA